VQVTELRGGTDGPWSLGATGTAALATASAAMFATITRLDSAVAIARPAVVVGIVVTAVVLRDAVVMVVVSRHRGWQRNGAADPKHGEADRDARLRC
jgi:hypothetical protein